MELATLLRRTPYAPSCLRNRAELNIQIAVRWARFQWHQ